MTGELIQTPSECKLEETYQDISALIRTQMEERGIAAELIRSRPGLSQGWDMHPSPEVFPSPTAFPWFQIVDTTLVADTPPVEKCNVVGRVGSGPFSLVMHAHIDTRCIGTESWEHPPFSGEVEKGCIWGLGAADNKSGIALAVASVSELHLPDNISVVLAFTADEEMGGYTGMGYLTEGLRLPQDFVLSTNGPFYKVNVGCWGRLWAVVSVEDPRSPENTQLYRLLRENHLQMNRKLRENSVPLQIASVGRMVQGFIMVTCNTFSPQPSSANLYSLLCRASPSIHFGMKVLDVSDQVVSKKTPLFDTMASAVRSVLGKELPFQMGPLSDIRFSLRRGVDAAAFGPIQRDSHVHQPDEHVRLCDLVACKRIYQQFLLSLADVGTPQ